MEDQLSDMDVAKTKILNLRFLYSYDWSCMWKNVKVSEDYSKRQSLNEKLGLIRTEDQVHSNSFF